ncbi:unnamed protein product [Spirodela intermedia]|uniref:SnoaL-like domain-containing protein n=2 Tax=Spirodela intermedia TaxID=51605 RepID=A0A7I8JDI7_SPIIN|nr:unnamed protein product [Spirodela intermedia]CAA6668149.1 unnamed protein product [Spirodela intermedia]CAA7404982.1 unnamed protein product [Spirodela intermedia]
MELGCGNCAPSKSQVPLFPRHVAPLKYPAGVSSRRWGRQSAGSPTPGKDSFPMIFENRRTLSASTVPRAAASSSSSSASASSSSVSLEVSPGSTVVREFYDRINRRDVASVGPLISDDCVYEDLIFSSPFVGRKAILDFFKKFMESVSSDLQFVIDDISSDDSSAIGVTWHLEWQGRTFPFSKGCSFYRLEVVDGKRQIVYGRDLVEPAIKPGEMALVLIRAVTSILQQFPQLADRF